MLDTLSVQIILAIILVGLTTMIRGFGGKINPLLARRSIVKYDISKKVSSESVDKALNAAVLAPNHFLTAPWRYYVCGESTKASLCGMNEEKRKIAEGVPEWLVVTMKSEHGFGEKLWLEDHAATAASIQNFMLSLASEGIGSKWMTGALGVPPETVKTIVGAKDEEHFMGVVWYGYPATELSETAKSPKRKLSIDDVKVVLP